MVSAVVLATETTDPKGNSKQYLRRRGKVVLQWVLESVLATAVSEVICVVHDLLGARLNVSTRDERLSWLFDAQVKRGQSSSIIAGLWAVDPRSRGVLFFSGEGPIPEPALVDALITRSTRVSAPIIAPVCNGRIRGPALFRREIFPELLKLEGDQGLNRLIKKYRSEVDPMPWNGAMKFEGATKRVQQRIKLPA